MDQDSFVQLHRIQGKIFQEKLKIYRLIESSHRGRQGKKLEDALCNLMRDFLPERYGVATGRLVDSHGNTSRQSDVIVYDKLFNAKLIFEDRNDKYVPIEAARCVIEVKSTLNPSALDSALVNLESIRNLGRAHAAALAGVIHQGNIHIPPVNFYIFAFDKYSDNPETLLNLVQRKLGSIREEKGRYINYLSFFPNSICVNSFGNISLMKASTREEHQNQDTPYYEPQITTYGESELMLGLIKNNDDALFYFLINLLEEADKIPATKSRFLSLLLVERTADVLVRGNVNYEFPRRTD